MMLSFQTELTELFIEYAYLLKSEKLQDIEKEMFNTVLNLKANEIETRNALKLLSRLLYKEFDKPVYLIIDEYDVPLQSAYVEGYYEDAIKFFKAFYGITFKDNQYMEKTVIKGIENNEGNIWGLLLGTGYLKVVETVNISEGIYKVQIPNKEALAI